VAERYVSELVGQRERSAILLKHRAEANHIVLFPIDGVQRFLDERKLPSLRRVLRSPERW
jgi:hypothetical protein